MSSAAPQPWMELFEPPVGPGNGVELPCRELRRNGKPFLLLPSSSRFASATVGLYPAQTFRARLFKGLARLLLRAGLSFGTERTVLRVSIEDPFWKFLTNLDGGTSPAEIGILAGNSGTPGTRFIIVQFRQDASAVAVIKAGATETARALIGKEVQFLQTAPKSLRGLPKLRNTFASIHVRALAMDFVEGHSSPREDERAVSGLLESWLDEKRTVALCEAPAWQTLELVAREEPRLNALVSHCRKRTVAPCVQHGDFAPWNVRVSRNGVWTVLDWERGELTGVPGWDWFHFVMQPAILVQRLPIPRIVEKLEALLARDSFQSYSARAGTKGFEKDLVACYLAHAVSVTRPSEGLSQSKELLAALRERWQMGSS